VSTLKIDDRVVWNRGPGYGLHRGRGVVKSFETYSGVYYVHVRFDDPGLDDEMIPASELTRVEPVPALSEQADPVPNNLPQIADLVKADIDARRDRGIETYGQPLQPMNDRDALQDLYEELLDGAHYARQRIEEERVHLARLAGDDDAPARIAEITRLAGGIERNAPVSSGSHDLAKGTLYLLRLFHAQAHELRKAVQALVRAEHPPADLEVAGYQYRVAHPTESPVYDPYSYDQNWIDRWCANPDRKGELVEGYFPEYRPVYGGAWRPVDPEKPPEPPPGGCSVPVATDTPEVSARPPETSPEPWAPIGPEDSLPHLIRRICVRECLTQMRMADKTGIPLSTLVQIQNYYVPVDPHLITLIHDAFNLPDQELEHLVELAVRSCNNPASCPSVSCGHSSSQHSRNWGCIRCTCKWGRVLSDPDLTDSQSQ